MKDDRLHLVHISEAIDRIRLYTSDGVERFLSDTMVQDAVLRNLQTLAESSMRLSEALKSSRAEVPWKAIYGFRNVVVHDYLGMDMNQIWDIVIRDILILKTATDAMMEHTEEPGNTEP